MDTREFFIQKLSTAQDEGRTLHYSDFEDMGLSQECFFYYINKCEEVRACCILRHTSDIRFVEGYGLRTALEAIVAFVLAIIHEERLRLHGSGSDFDFYFAIEKIRKSGASIPKDALAFLRYGFSFDTSLGSNFVYSSLDDFRLLLEKVILCALLEKDNIGFSIICPSDNDDIDCPIEEAKERIAQIQKEQSRIESKYKGCITFDIYCGIDLYSRSDFNYYEWASDASTWQGLEENIEELERHIDKLEKEPHFTAKGGVLYVHKGRIKCQRQKHDIECINGVVSTSQGKNAILNINHCKNCGLFFISYDEFQHYRSMYHTMLCNFRFIDGETMRPFKRKLADESVLHIAGYNVNADEDVPEEERHYILERLIHDRILRKDEIITRLNDFIRVNGAQAKNYLAVEKWEADLEFVRSIDQPKQDIYALSDIRRYGEE